MTELAAPQTALEIQGEPWLRASVWAALADARTKLRPAALLLGHSPLDEAPQEFARNVRHSDVVADLKDGTVGILVVAIGRIAAASIAERLETRVDGAKVGMTLIAARDLRTADLVVDAARLDLDHRRGLRAPQEFALAA